MRMRRATPGRIEKVIVGGKKRQRVIIITIATYGGLLAVYIYGKLKRGKYLAGIN